MVYGKRSLSSLESETPDQTSLDARGLHITNDPLETLSNIAHRFTSALHPGAHIVEVLPILDYLPEAMAKWKRDARRDFQKISGIFQKYFDDAVRSQSDVVA